MEVFGAVDAPITWDIIDDFSFEDKSCRAMLKNNRNIIVGNNGREGVPYTYKIPMYKYLGLYVRSKFQV
jgi:hypothetical protein